MLQHGSLTPERWIGFTLDQQILMIGNEMNRAASLQIPFLSDALRPKPAGTSNR